MSTQGQHDHTPTPRDGAASSTTSSATTTTTATYRQPVIGPAEAQRLMGWHWYDWAKTVVAVILAILLLYGGVTNATSPATVVDQGGNLVVVPAATESSNDTAAAVSPSTSEAAAPSAPTAPPATPAPTTPPATPTTTGPTALPNAPAAVTDTVTLRVAYSPEKAEWLLPQIDAYNAAQRQTPDGATIVVDAVPLATSDQSAQELDQAEADVWFPAASLSIPAVATDWQGIQGNALSAEQPTSIVRSPIVIGMWTLRGNESCTEIAAIAAVRCHRLTDRGTYRS